MTTRARIAFPFLPLLALLMVFLVGCPRPLTVGLPAESAMPALRGTLLGEGGYTTQATSLAEIASGATVSLIDPADGGTIATSLTQPDGTFALTFGAWKPTSDVPYLLEAVKGLSIGGEPNRPSANVARLRTLVMHSGGSWKSLTRMADGSDVIRINQSTTALCVISGLKSLSAPQLLDLEHRVVITAGQPDAFIPTPEIAAGEYVSVWALVDASLGFNQDPVRVVALNTETGLYSRLERGPLVTDLSTLKGESGTQLVLYGNGFDLTAANNKVFFNGSTVPAPGVTVNATGTQLTVPVPADAGVGSIVVQVGKIRCLVAGGTVFKPGAVLEHFAGTTEIPPGISATSYPISPNPSVLSLGLGGELFFFSSNVSNSLLKVSTGGILSRHPWQLLLGEGAPCDVGTQGGGLRDSQGNLFWPTPSAIWMVPATSGTHFGKAMLAGHAYSVAGDGRTSGANAGPIDDVPATSIRISFSWSNQRDQIAVDAQGNLFFGDNLDRARLRMVPRTSGTYYGQAMTANHIYTLDSDTLTNNTYVRHVGLDSTGNVYFTRGLQIRRIRKVDLNGTVTEPVPGFTSTTNQYGHGFVVAGDGTLYLSRDGVLQKIVGATVSTIMGSYPYDNSEDGEPLSTAKVQHQMYPLVLSPEGHLYLGDSLNNCIRMIPKTNGTYHGKAMLADHLYVVAGTRGETSPDATPKEWMTWLSSLYDLKVDALGNVYTTSSTGTLTMIPAVSGTYFGKAMTAGHVYNLDIGTDNASPKHLALLPNGEIYFYTPENVPYVGTRCFVRKIALDGSISDVLMDETAFSIATDPAGNLYIRTAHKVEMVPAANGTYFGKAMTAGNRYTIAGNGSSGADTGIATGATLQGLPSIAFDADGNLYATMSNSPYQIRMVPNVAGTYFGQAMNVGEIYPIATVQNNTTKSLTLDSLGNVYAWTSSGNKIVRISPNGQVSPFAGGGAGGEGGLAKKAALLAPTTMTFGPDGSLYFLRDSRVMRIR